MACSFTEGPASFVADRIHNGHADDRFELFQFAHNNSAMCSGTGPRHIQMVTAFGSGIAGTSISRDPIAKGIRLPAECALVGLLMGELRLDHGGLASLRVPYHTAHGHSVVMTKTTSGDPAKARDDVYRAVASWVPGAGIESSLHHFGRNHVARQDCC